MVRLLAAFMLAACSFAAAAAGFVTGDVLKAKLDGYVIVQEGRQTSVGEVVDASFALGYVAGVVDGSARLYICPPPKVTMNQMAEIVHKYLQDNPSEWSLPADQLTTRALSGAFPCPKKK